MNPSAPAEKNSTTLAVVCLLGGILLLFGAWTLPVNLKSLSLAILHAAGQGTPSVGAFGRELVDYEKLGPASLVLVTAKSLKDPRADALSTAIDGLAAHQPELVAWGGWDPFLDPLFNLRESKGRAASTPILTFFLPAKARETLRSYLANSRSLGVQTVLKTREATDTGRFIVVSKPGGQPLDAIILLTALLYQGEHLSPTLQRELRGLAEDTVQSKKLGDLEPFYGDLLSLAQRLDWIQLCELLRRTDSTRTVGEYAHLARVAPEPLALIYTAALFSGSADRVATYLIQYGKAGVEDLRLAVGEGQGAVRQLLQRQVPVARSHAPELGGAAEFSLLHPMVALTVKWLGFLLGAFLMMRGLDLAYFSASSNLVPGAPHLQSGVLSLLIAGVLILATEPYLLNAAPPSEFQLRLTLPVLSNLSANAPEAPVKTPFTMNVSTLISVAFFALLQISMYLICSAKIRDISRMALPPLVKLKLMENEENLFDGGLYIGIGGTATALVLQVLGVIEQNLLAAYASNLFGITCVALVKIRSVRPYKRSLILQSQQEARVVAA